MRLYYGKATDKHGILRKRQTKTKPSLLNQ